MKYKYITLVSTFLISGIMTNPCMGNGKVRLGDLLQDMNDKSCVTYYPKNDYSLHQYSSYDRASVEKERNLSSWYSNSDCSQFIREEINDGRKEQVMFDACGPGCVTRFWVTGGGGHIEDVTIRVYLDNSSVPVLEGNYFQLIGYNKLVGRSLSFTAPEAAPAENRGHNLYLPIPYSKHCKITCESDYIGKGQMLYYNINYRTYDSKTDVESFTVADVKKLTETLKDVEKSLANPRECADKKTIETKNWNFSLSSRASEKFTIKKSGLAINQISIKLKAQDLGQALRSTVVKMVFDGDSTVWCPLGDFFGVGHKLLDTHTLYTDVDSKNNLLETTWVMPFKNDCEVEIQNLGGQTVNLETKLGFCKYQWKSNSMHFGSTWYQLNSIPTGENKERNGKGGVVDLNYVTLRGKGVYVGDALSIYNPALGGHWKIWWGEGDEKIYVDGESFPSHFGTGTEDYYGYAWCRGEAFTSPFIAQPIGEGNLSTGYSVNSRYRLLDAIPFHNSLKFDMELWHWIKTKINFAPVTFFYMLPGGESNVKPDEKGAELAVPTNRFDVLSNNLDSNGLIEGEDLKYDMKGSKNITGFYDDVLSGGLSLMWNDVKKGDVLDLIFNVAEEGVYKVLAQIVKNQGFAKVRFYLNGELVNKEIQSQSGNLDVAVYELGSYSLRKGDNILKIESMDADATKFAIDYMKIKK